MNSACVEVVYSRYVFIFDKTLTLIRVEILVSLDEKLFGLYNVASDGDGPSVQSSGPVSRGS